MRNWFIGQGIPIYVMTAVLVMGIFTLWMSDRIYKRLIKEADLMGTSNHRLIKYIKLKIQSYFKIGMRPEDTQSLARRYIMKYKTGPFSTQTWRRLPGLMEAVLLLEGACVMLYRYTAGQSLAEASMIMAAAIIGAALIHSLAWFVDFSSKEVLLESTISDYVENFLMNKLEADFKDQNPVPPEQYKRALSEVAATQTKERRKRQNTYHYDRYVPPEGLEEGDEVDAKIVEDVLKEFLN